MRKPNIQIGELGTWIAHKREEPVGLAEYEIWWSNDGECIAEVVHEEANAKAISVVPEMIDELIKSNELISELLGIVIEPEAVAELKRQYAENVEVLKKAGCRE